MRIYFGRVRTRMGLGWDKWTPLVWWSTGSKWRFWAPKFQPDMKKSIFYFCSCRCGEGVVMPHAQAPSLLHIGAADKARLGNGRRATPDPVVLASSDDDSHHGDVRFPLCYDGTVRAEPRLARMRWIHPG